MREIKMYVLINGKDWKESMIDSKNILRFYIHLSANKIVHQGL